MRRIVPALTAAALAASVVACSNPQSAPEPEKAAGMETPGATTTDGAQQRETAPAY